MDLPTYIKQQNQENFIEELTQTLLDNLSNNGFVIPAQNTATITSLSLTMPVPTLWYNTDINKLQFSVAAGVVQTITSV